MIKRFFLSWLVGVSLTAFAQQEQVRLRTNSPLLFPEFKTAKVLQTFGRSVRAEANIFLKDASLLFKQGDSILVASNASILGVQFGDSLTFLKVGQEMGEVLASRNHNSLVCVTTIDREQLRNETSGGTNLPFFEIEGFSMGPLDGKGAFLNIEGDKYDDSKGYPLRSKYYFLVLGQVVPANETAVKKVIRPEMKKAFKNLMADRWWSWRDAESLKQLLVYFPEK